MAADTRLGIEDVRTIKSALWAAVEGTFFPEWEFQTLFGLERLQVRRVYEAWPDVYFDHEVNASIVGALNLLVGYPHHSDAELLTYVASGANGLRATLERYLTAVGE